MWKFRTMHVGAERSLDLGAQPLQLLLAPARSPFVERDSPAQHEVDEGRVFPRNGVDLAQHLQVLLVPAFAALEQLQRLVPRQRVGEEEPQQRLVAQLDRHRVAVEPLDERLTAGRGQLVDLERKPMRQHWARPVKNEKSPAKLQAHFSCPPAKENS